MKLFHTNFTNFSKPIPTNFSQTKIYILGLFMGPSQTWALKTYHQNLVFVVEIVANVVVAKVVQRTNVVAMGSQSFSS
jgi:hypothetical protein